MLRRSTFVPIMALAALIQSEHLGGRQPETAQVLWQFEAGG